MDLLNILILILVLYVVYKIISLAIRQIHKKAGQKLENNAAYVLDDIFDGKPTAVYEVADVGTLKFKQVIEGAEKRGYALHAQNQGTSNLTTLVFRKAA